MKDSRNIPFPTIDEIRLYHAGKLSPSRAHEIELLALESTLVNDALEGYKSFEDFGRIPGRNNFHRGPQRGWWIAGAVIAAGVVLWLLKPPGELTEKGSDASHSTVSVPEKTKPDIARIDMSEMNPVDSYDVSGTDAERRIFKYDKPLPGEVTTDSVMHTTVYEYDISDYIESLPPSIEPVESESDTAASDIKPARITSSEKIYHIHNYKLVDYRDLRHDDWFSIDPSTLGTPANMESGKYDPGEEIKGVPYVDYVAGAIGDFASGKYELANSQLRTILRQYPDDINALFYSGVCEFHTKKYSRAISQFKKCLAHPILTFHEDAEFYLAKSLFFSGNKAEAGQLMEQIIEADGYYSSQARDFMSSEK